MSEQREDKCFRDGRSHCGSGSVPVSGCCCHFQEQSHPKTSLGPDTMVEGCRSQWSIKARRQQLMPQSNSVNQRSMERPFHMTDTPNTPTTHRLRSRCSIALPLHERKTCQTQQPQRQRREHLRYLSPRPDESRRRIHWPPRATWSRQRRSCCRAWVARSASECLRKTLFVWSATNDLPH